MTLDELRIELTAAVEAIKAKPSGLNYLARGADLPSSTVGKISFDDTLTRDVAADVIAYAESLLSREWLAYDPSYQLSANQALVDGLDQVPELARVQAAVSSGRAALDDRESGTVVATVHRARVDADTAITAYRVKGAGIATRRPRGLLALAPRGAVYERIDSEILYYEPKFDALVIGEHLFVTAVTTLQRSLGSSARAQKLAATTFVRATVELKIEGAEALAEAVASDPVMVAKMAQLARTLDAEPEYAALLTTERLLKFLDKNPQIPIATTGEGKQRRLLFEASPQKRYLIVKALADDYLRSELSERRYEVGSKSRLPD